MKTKVLIVGFAIASAMMAQPKTFERRVEIIGHAGEAQAGVFFGQAGVPAGETVQFISAELGLPGQIVKGAPYTADAVNESVQVLADGNRIVRKNTSQVARDGEGRTRRHDKLDGIGPWAADAAHEVIFINDPVARANWVLEPKDKIARKMRAIQHDLKPDDKAQLEWKHLNEKIGREEVRHIAVRPHAAASLGKSESLGKRNIEGVIAEGTRTTMTIPAGDMGNERPIEIVSERWFSPELQTVVLTKRNDPRSGETTYRLANIVRAEPARSLFEVPPDYQVKEIQSDVKIMRREKKQ